MGRGGTWSPRGPTGWLVAVAALLAGAPACVTAQGIPGVGRGGRLDREWLEYRNEVLEIVRESMADWEDAWNGDQHQDIVEFYAPDAYVVLEDRRMRGILDLLNGFAEVLPAMGPIRLSLLEFELDGDMAYAFGEVRARGDGPGPDVSPHVMTIYVRDGSDWFIKAQLFQAGDVFDEASDVDAGSAGGALTGA